MATAIVRAFAKCPRSTYFNVIDLFIDMTVLLTRAVGLACPE
jgi:hypothetical protein